MINSRVIAVLFLLVLVATVVHAREVPVSGKVTAILNEPVGAVDVLPLPVRADKDTSLRVIAATQLSTETVFVRERESYDSVRTRWVNASSTERSALQSELVEQRRRLLVATLNRITANYQRQDLIISTMDTTLFRLRSLHNSRTSSLSNFDVRHSALRAQLDDLHTQSDRVADEIASCQNSIELSTCVRSSRDQTAELLSSLKAFFSSYRALALDVVQ